MTTLLVCECPAWTDDIPEAKQEVFRRATAAAYAEALRGSRRSIASVEHICFWHKIMFACVAPLPYYAGGVRCDDPDRPCLGVNVEVAGVAGCPYHNAPDAFSGMIDESRRRIALSEVWWDAMTPRERVLRLSQVLAYLIGEFIRTHPFLNGNGRTSRVLWAWGLRRFGVPPQCRIAPRPASPYGEVMAKAMNGDDISLALLILQHLAANGPNREP